MKLAGVLVCLVLVAASIICASCTAINYGESALFDELVVISAIPFIISIFCYFGWVRKLR